MYLAKVTYYFENYHFDFPDGLFQNDFSSVFPQFLFFSVKKRIILISDDFTRCSLYAAVRTPLRTITELPVDFTRDERHRQLGPLMVCAPLFGVHVREATQKNL